MNRPLVISSALNLVIAAAFAATMPASAADMPVYKAAPAPVPVYNWTGFYVGGNVGYSWGNVKPGCDYSSVSNLHPVFNFYKHDFVPNLTNLPTDCSDIRLKPEGVIAGGQAGFNQQINSWVWGLEADFQWSGQKDSHNHNRSDDGSIGKCFYPKYSEYSEYSRLKCFELTEQASVETSLDAKLSYFGTIRARGGFLITPQVLVFVTGGGAYGEVKVSGSGVANATAAFCITYYGTKCLTESIGSQIAISESKLKFGYTAGGGIEGVLSGPWTLRFEYLYINLGKLSGTDSTGTFTWKTGDFTDHIARLAINYRLPY